MQIAFLGLGLIGGSVARAVVASRWADRVTAWSPSGRGPRSAAGHGIAAAPSVRAAILDADLVVLAAPPFACLDLVDALAGDLADALAADAVVTDVMSSKAAIVARARAAGLRFVGGHPMAGREVGGYEASDPDLLRARPWVVVPPDPPDQWAVDRVAALATACGARPIRMTASAHDAAVGAISHLPLVVSAALVEAMAGAPDWPASAELAAGGWASMSRLARGDAEMGVGMLTTNAGPVAERLRAFRKTLDAWLAALEADPPVSGELRRRLTAAREQAMAADGGSPRGGGDD